jgi:hypothetical protein
LTYVEAAVYSSDERTIAAGGWRNNNKTRVHPNLSRCKHWQTRQKFKTFA